MTIGDILSAHGYRDGSDEDRLLAVFRDLQREKAIVAVYEISTPAHMRPIIEMGIKTLVDS